MFICCLQVSNWFTNYRARRWRIEVASVQSKRRIHDSDSGHKINTDTAKEACMLRVKRQHF